MESGRNLWRLWAIVTTAAAIVLAVLLHDRSEEVAALEAQAPATPPAVPPEVHAGQIEPAQPEQLALLLKDNDPKVRYRALALLAVWKPELINTEVAEMIRKDPDAEVRLAALAAVGENNIVAAYDAVLETVKDPDVSMRRKAVAVLGQLAEALEGDRREQAAREVVASLNAERTKVGRELTQSDLGLLHPHMVALGALKTESATKALLDLLATPNAPLIRRVAAESLVGHQAKDMEKKLQAAWRNETDRMARAAIEKVLEAEPYRLVVDKEKHTLVPARPR